MSDHPETNIHGIGPDTDGGPNPLYVPSTAPTLLEAAKGLLALMDDVPIDAALGDETDRVFSYREFEPLRAAIAKATGKS